MTSTRIGAAVVLAARAFGTSHHGLFGTSHRRHHPRQLCPGWHESEVCLLGADALPVSNEQGRLVQGHPASGSFRENHWPGLADRRTVAPRVAVTRAAETHDLHHSAGHHWRKRAGDSPDGGRRVVRMHLSCFCTYLWAERPSEAKASTVVGAGGRGPTDLGQPRTTGRARRAPRRAAASGGEQAAGEATRSSARSRSLVTAPGGACPLGALVLASNAC